MSHLNFNLTASSLLQGKSFNETDLLIELNTELQAITETTELITCYYTGCVVTCGDGIPNQCFETHRTFLGR
jgi:hypothetical protein